jgi:N-acetylglucosaminyldiphosphoundecaprenol N-acetyl-beta-D-mannosaminyltransferase
LTRPRLRVVGADQPDGIQRFYLCGLPIAATSFEGAVEYLLDAPLSSVRLRVHFAAAHTIVEATRDPQLYESLREADLIFPDGMPLVWAGRLKGRRTQRVCGPDTMLALLDRSRERGYRHFFYGGTPRVASELAEAMTARFPGLQVAGVYSPPFRPLSWREVEDTVALINDSGAHYVWVGLGSPKQDEWLAAFRPLLHAPVILAVGAAFDFHAGRLRRAPRWAQRLGLEWAFRLASEPRRLAGRYVFTGLRFARLLIVDRVRPQGVAR